MTTTTRKKKPAEKLGPVNEMTIEEMVESVSGLEELAIDKHFERDIQDLMENRPTFGVRALIFIEKIRQGAVAPEAKKACMELTLGRVMTWYADAPDEFDPDAPDSESGKDEPAPNDAP